MTKVAKLSFTITPLARFSIVHVQSFFISIFLLRYSERIKKKLPSSEASS